jgi:hypothetical protein
MKQTFFIWAGILVLAALHHPAYGQFELLEHEAGICAYAFAGRPINLQAVRNALQTVESQIDDYIIGSLRIPEYTEHDDAHIYAHRDGWVAAYYLRNDPVAKVADLVQYEGGQIERTKLDIALQVVEETVGVALRNVKHFDFSRPEANRLLIVVELLANYRGIYPLDNRGAREEAFRITLPDEFVAQHRSFGFFATTRGVLLLDGTSLADTGWNPPSHPTYNDIPITLLKKGSTHQFEIKANGNDPKNAWGVPHMAAAVAFVYREPPRIIPSEAKGALVKELTPPTAIAGNTQKPERANMSLSDTIPSSIVSVPTYALIVGTGTYDHYSDLVNPTLDAQAIEKELHEVYRCETKLILDPTRAKFLNALIELTRREYSENDQLLVFISGHGAFNEEWKQGFLAFRDTRAPEIDPLWDSFVAHERVRTLLERLSCRHILVMVDSCFAGTLDPTIAMAPDRSIDNPYPLASPGEFIARKLQYRTRKYITAGGKEFVPDGRPGQHSPFARQFLEALRGFGGEDGILTLEEIRQYLEKAHPEPRFGNLHDDEAGGSFVLVARKNGSDPESGTLNVYMIPSDAAVTLERFDSTDRGFIREDTRHQPRIFIVPIGRYRVQATRSGYADLSQIVEIRPGVQSIRLRLEPIGR